ncbi:hypothetical protein SLEP1_g22028 [Rubroshorea leprosula]|uniref:RING-type E3 ubiquitin transferase n=1 Tax=Rubroshorea leprosula TaxID=152421 RepID=A0AAV5J7W5_9ROSI|nr:hypothetical protein SLEP1_g22028 [Rubroshorea leprosula]
MEDHQIRSLQQFFFIVLFLIFFFALISLFYVMYKCIWNNGHRLFGGNRNSSSNDELEGHRNTTDGQNDSNRNPTRIQNRSDNPVRGNINLNQGSGSRERFAIRTELAAVLVHVQQQLERQRNERTITIGELAQPMSYRSYERTVNSTECAICLEEFSGDDECRVLPICKHIYHMGCIDRWLMDELTCPICRTNVTEHA